MIPLPASIKLVIGLILIGGIAALQALAKVETGWLWAGGVIQFLTAAELYFTVPSAAAKQLAAKVAPPAAFLLILGALATTQPACKGSALPVIENVVSVVEADLAAGKSDAQMASDVCAALGGSVLTDAICASAETILQDVIVYLIDSGKLSAPAQQRAASYMAAHPKAAK